MQVPRNFNKLRWPHRLLCFCLLGCRKHAVARCPWERILLSHNRNKNFSSEKLQLTSKLQAWSPSIQRHFLSLLLPLCSSKTFLALGFCYCRGLHLNSSWNSLRFRWEVFWGRPLSSLLSVLTLRQLQPVALIWQLITESYPADLLVKLSKCWCSYSWFSQIRNSSQAGSGQVPPLHSTQGPEPKLQKYLFIYSASR